jgi:TolB-like protein
MRKKIMGSKRFWLVMLVGVLGILGLLNIACASKPDLAETRWKPDGWEAEPDILERIEGGTLAVLPFAGGSGDDGETIAELFSFDQTLNKVFIPIPRTSITAAMRQERSFQLGAGMTDPDSVIALGRELGARYVIAGNIAQLGDQNLLIISILNTETLEQIAGDILTYRNIEEIQEKLAGIAGNITRGTRRDTASLPKLAVIPFIFAGQDDARDVLAQILAVNFLRSGKYAVYPRTVDLSKIQSEWQTQLSGDTADENIVRIGSGDNPRYVLTGAARRLGDSTMFNASIIDLESGAQKKGDSVNYNTLNDGIEIMEFLTAKLSDNSITVSSREEFIQAINLINHSGEGSYFIVAKESFDLSSNVNFIANAVKTITIIGDNIPSQISHVHYRHSKHEYPFITVPQKITLILGNNLTIYNRTMGGTSNTIWVEGGTLELRDGATLTSSHPVNTRNNYSNVATSVVVKNGGIFNMKGGTITKNIGQSAAGVYVSNGSFFMSGGTISNWQGRTCIRIHNGIFIKTGGIIERADLGESLTVYAWVRGDFPQKWGRIGPDDNLDSRLQGEAGGWR